MTKHVKLLALILSVAMLAGAFMTACKTKPEPSVTPQQTEGESNVESSTDKSTEKESSLESGENNTEACETDYTEILDYEGSKTVEYADFIKDRVNSAYCDGTRTSAFIENINMKLVHGLNGNLKNSSIVNNINSLTNAAGNAYISNTMDAFVKTADGKTYFATDWIAGPYFNQLKSGYYYQDVRISGQGFGDMDTLIENAVNIDLSTFASTSSNQVGNLHIGDDGILSFDILNTGADPGIQSSADLRDSGIEILSKNYNALIITMKTEDAYVAELFVKTHKMSNYAQSGAKMISLIPGDDFHTYIVRLDDLPSYSGYLTGVRIDLGKINGETVQIHSIKAANISNDVVPVRVERGFHVYPDKLHQELHFVTTDDTKSFASYGMVTKIAENTVNKLIVKDAKGTHESLDGVDWSSAEYVGFDIDGAGIFGYILPNSAPISGSIRVTLENGNYIITQEIKLESGEQIANKTHFYMGHRIYTDATHSFADLEREAMLERNPLSGDSITVEYETSNRSEYNGYDHLRGAYKVTVRGTSFSNAYYNLQNRHYTAKITVKSDSNDRKIYIYSSSTSSGLECATILNAKELMMPIPLEVIKNFAGDGEQSIFNADNGFSEVFMPVKADSGESFIFSMLHLYQNWGHQPLKQLSWIQFGTPYYHLSTGVTETNCIMPMYGGGPAWQLINNPDAGYFDEFYVYSGKSLSTLPDFRAMSGILWSDQPQHNSCMDMTWLEYYDSDGKWVASEVVNDTVHSYGPTYADITLDYISDDGKITSTYRHAEMPQTDENRTYYSIRHDVIGDLSITDFKENFTIFETNSRFGPYQYTGYLNENNQMVVEESLRTGEHRFITLGNEAPYYGYFYYYLSPDSRMCNYAVIIKDWDIVIGGQKYTDNLIIEEWFQNGMNFTRLTLNVGDVTLKEGDYIDINMILLPWGKANDTQDANVRQVRQDSCLYPYSVSASVGSVIEDDFIPMVKAENNVAEFTFSGGHNNGVVRVYGFDKLTSPTIEELVNGEWQKYEVSSVNTPDGNGNAHYYDGYCVYYDGDGSYSYSFVIPTDQGEERTFRVKVEDFKGYPKDPSPEVEIPDVPDDSGDSDSLVDPNEERPTGQGAPKLYFSAQDLYLLGKDENVSKHMLDVASLKIEDGTKFARYLTYGLENQDAYIVLHQDSENSVNAAPYILIKYRTTVPHSSFEFWLNSGGISYAPGSNNTHISLMNDGEWHCAILDLSIISKDYFNGRNLNLFRFDFLNTSTSALPANSSVDIAYIGFFATESEAGKFAYGESFKTQEEIKQENYDLCVDPEGKYTISDKVFGTNIDFINGESLVWDGGNSKAGVSVIDYSKTTLSDGSLVISGWTVVDGGIEKYIWSADGGKTWYKTGLHTIKGIGNGAGAAHYKVVTNKIGSHTFSDDTPFNSVYQVSAANPLGGIALNLTPYTGQTVDVVFAAVPAKATDTVCPLILFKNVTVAGSSTAPEKDTFTPPQQEGDDTTDTNTKEENNAGCIDPTSGYTESTLTYGANLDFINAIALKNQGGNSVQGCSVYTDEYSTIKGSCVVFTGWFLVDGGVKDYVYSTDGGKTWTVIPGTPGNGAGDAHINVLKRRMGSDISFAEGYNIKSTFQGAAADGEKINGLTVDLSSHAGETVELIFAAIPINEPQSLCLIAKLTNVKVANAN